MIENPTQIKHSDDWYELISNKIGQAVFYINTKGDSITLSYVIDNKYPVARTYDIFSINKRYKFIYCVLGATATKEEFLGFLSKDYPEYMEWFLFNKEWLD
jgi:hypothetical protein